MPRLAELVGRVMVDPEFLAALQRSPESILAEYELNDDERSVVLRALARLAQMPAAQRETVVLDDPAAMCRAAALGLGIALVAVPDALRYLDSAFD